MRHLNSKPLTFLFEKCDSGASKPMLKVLAYDPGSDVAVIFCRSDSALPSVIFLHSSLPLSPHTTALTPCTCHHWHARVPAFIPPCRWCWAAAAHLAPAISSLLWAPPPGLQTPVPQPAPGHLVIPKTCNCYLHASTQSLISDAGCSDVRCAVGCRPFA